MTEDTAYLQSALSEARAEVARLTVEHRHQREVIGQQSQRLMDQAATLAAVRELVKPGKTTATLSIAAVRRALDGAP